MIDNIGTDKEVASTNGRIKYSWAEIDAEYLSTDLSVNELAEKRGINEHTLRAHVTKFGLHDIRDSMRKQNAQKLINAITEKDYKIQASRFEALNEMVEKFRQDPLARVTASEALAAIKQIGLMLGEADKRVEHTVLVYDIEMGNFPDAKIVEGEADLIEGDLPPLLGEGDVEEG